MSFKVGARVDTGKCGKGYVEYYGTTQFAEGEWVGVRLDEPKGKNNGIVKDVEYFKCEPNYGLFVRPTQLTLERSPGLKAPTSALRKESLSASNRNSPSVSPRMSPSGSKENLSKAASPRKPPSSSKLSEMDRPKMSRESSNLSVKNESPAVDEEPSRPVATLVKKVEEKHSSALPSPIHPTFSLEGTTQVERLLLEVKDLTEKVDTLRMKRKEDQLKIRELELESQKLLSLQHIKAKLAEENLELTRQLDMAKLEATELREWKNANQEQMNNNSQELEMALIDKEMAEERLDDLQKELDSWKDKADELETNLNILRDEMAAGGGAAPSGNSVQLKQLEAQNEKYRTAIVKLHEIVQDEKLKAESNEIEAERLKIENAEIIRIAEMEKQRIEELEKRVREYQEQSDAAMDAEEMVTILTNKNLEMEEKIAALEQEKEDLEELHDMDDQLSEEQKGIERDLRKDIDGLQARIQELVQKLLTEERHSDGLMDTIMKFREKTSALNEQIQDLNDQILRYEDALNGQQSEEKSAASLASQLQVNAARTFSESVERQLNAIELEFSRKQIGYVKVFLPDNFSKAGGDYDGVLLNVLFPRLVSKAVLLPKLASERFPPVPGGVRREHVTKSHKAEQWGQVAKVAYKSAALATVCTQFESAIHELSVERLARLSQLQLEMSAHEKTVDQYIDLLKQGRFDENTSLDNFEKTLIYFQNTFSVHVGWNGFSCKKYLTSVCRQMQLSAAWMKSATQRILFAISADVDASEVHDFVSMFNAEIEQYDQLILRIQKAIPENEFLVKQQFLEDVHMTISMLERLCALVHDVSNVASVQVNMSSECDGLDAGRMKEMIHGSVERVFGSTLLEKTFEPVEKQLFGTKSALTDLLSSLEKTEYENIDENAAKVYPPILERAHLRKQAAAEAEGLRWQLEKKDTEIQELKRNIKSRIDDIGNYKLRLEMAEARMDSSGKQESAKLKLLEGKVEQLNMDIQRQKIEYDQAMEALQNDNRDLVKENEDLKKSQKNMSKIALLQGIQSMETRAAAASSPTKASPTSVVNPLTRAEIQFLELNLDETQRNLRNANLEILRLKAENAATNGLVGTLDLPDVVCGPETLRSRGPADSVLDALAREAENLKREELKYMVYFPDLTKPKHIQDEEKEQFIRAKENFHYRVSSIRARLHRHWALEHPGQTLPSKFRIERPTASCKTEHAMLDVHSPAFNSILQKWGKT